MTSQSVSCSLTMLHFSTCSEHLELRLSGNYFQVQVILSQDMVEVESLLGQREVDLSVPP